jgi:hypothetical protein
MGRSNGTPKSILIATRVTPRINGLVKQMAHREGLYVSEWVRKIIIAELSKNKMLGNPLYTPSSDSDDKSDDYDLNELSWRQR